MSSPRLLPSLAPLAACLLVPAAAAQAAYLQVEDLQGHTRVLDPGELPLTDPAARGIYLVRPSGGEEEVAVEPLEDAGEIRLVGGDRLRGRIRGGEGETLTLELIGGTTIPIDISRLRGFRIPSRLPSDVNQGLTAPAEGDRLYRRTGAKLDRIDGTIDSFSAEGIAFESLLGVKTFPWDEVAALFVEVLGDEPTAGSDATSIVCDLVDGSRVRGRLEAIDAKACKMTVAGGPVVELPWSYVSEAFIDDGRLAFLSDFDASGEAGKGVPFGDELGLVWEHRLDRAVTGAPLRAGGRTWNRGIGMHAPTRVSWLLDDRWAELRGVVAIDDSVLHNPKKARGAVTFRVHVDGELLWESGLVRGGDPPRPLPTLRLPAPKGGPRELVLEVDPMGDFRGDRADWLRMVLTQK